MSIIKRLKYFIYVRRSQDRDDRQILTIEDQRRELIEYANLHNLVIVDIYEESQSAYKKGRPKFAEMLDRIDKGEASGILVWHLTRIARNSLDGGLVIYMIDEGKIEEIRTINKTYRNDPNDKFILQIEFGMAKKTSDDTSQFVKRDMRGLVEKGAYPGIAPIGYINLDSQGRIAGKAFDTAKQTYFMDLTQTRSLKRIEIDPIDGPLVSAMFNWVAKEQLSLEELRQRAFQAGLKGKKNGSMMGKATISGILSNPFYYGWIHYGECEAWGNHDHLVEKEIFDRVQEVLHVKCRPRPKRFQHTHRRLVKCGECFSSVTSEVQKGRIYYRCTKKKGHCSQPYLREDALEEEIVKELGGVYLNDEIIEWALDQMEQAFQGDETDYELLRKQIQVELNRSREQQKNLLQLKIKPENVDGGLLSDDDFMKTKQELSQQEANLMKKSEEIALPASNWRSEVQDHFNFTTKLIKTYQKEPPETKRYILTEIGSNFSLKDKTLIFDANKPYSRHYDIKSRYLNWLELQKKPVPLGETGFFEDDRSLWRARPDSNRRSPA